MPNHIKTIIYTEPEESFDALMDHEGNVDFEKVIPMPPEVAYTKGKGLSSEDMKFPNWYDWCSREWGTKWNAYSPERIGSMLAFETAWAHPSPVMEKWIMDTLEKTPEAVISVAYADEDIGHNCGVYSVFIEDDGSPVIVSSDIDDGTDEALELASLIKYEEHYNAMMHDMTDGLSQEEIEEHGFHEIHANTMKAVVQSLRYHNMEALISLSENK